MSLLHIFRLSIMLSSSIHFLFFHSHFHPHFHFYWKFIRFPYILNSYSCLPICLESLSVAKLCISTLPLLSSLWRISIPCPQCTQSILDLDLDLDWESPNVYCRCSLCIGVLPVGRSKKNKKEKKKYLLLPISASITFIVGVLKLGGHLSLILSFLSSMIYLRTRSH